MTSNIASERKRIGYRQSDLAVELNVSTSTVARWEQGKLSPAGSNLAQMKKLFGCTTDYLLGLTDERL